MRSRGSLISAIEKRLSALLYKMLKVYLVNSLYFILLFDVREFWYFISFFSYYREHWSRRIGCWAKDTPWYRGAFSAPSIWLTRCLSNTTPIVSAQCHVSRSTVFTINMLSDGASCLARKTFMPIIHSRLQEAAFTENLYIDNHSYRIILLFLVEFIL